MSDHPLLGFWLGLKSCSASNISACVGPNGDVYHCQSYFENLDNILRDDWQRTWNNPLAVKIRQREYTESKCKDCEQLQVCGGGCLLELQKDSYVCSDAQ